MRVLTANVVFDECQLGVYGHTAMSWVIRGTGQTHLLTRRLDEGFRSSSQLAAALRMCGYREPVLGDSFNFNLAFQTDTSFWKYVGHTDPMRGKNFDAAMELVGNNDVDIIPILFPFDTLFKAFIPCLYGLSPATLLSQPRDPTRGRCFFTKSISEK